MEKLSCELCAELYEKGAWCWSDRKTPEERPGPKLCLLEVKVTGREGIMKVCPECIKAIINGDIEKKLEEKGLNQC